jgi:type I restriction enzyme R subunit
MLVAPNEFAVVEKALVEQLQSLGWEYLPGDIDVPCITDLESFREVLLKDRLRTALRKVNNGEDGEEWLDEVWVNEAVSALERIAAPSLVETNRRATQLPLKGMFVPGDPELHAGREQTIQ